MAGDGDPVLMLWNKHTYTVQLKGGRAQFKTEALHGLLQQLTVVPQTPDTIWSLHMKDRDGDILYETIDHAGRLDEREGIPVGGERSEALTIVIDEATKNERFDLLFKVREIK